MLETIKPSWKGHSMTTPDNPVAEAAPSPAPQPPEHHAQVFTTDVTPATPAAPDDDAGGANAPTAAARQELPRTGQPPATPAEAVLKEESAEKRPDAPPGERQAAPASILAIDIGGTKVKILATGQTESRKAPTGKDFTPAKLVETVRALAHDWDYEAVTIGYPGLVGPHGPRSEPGNLGPGWVGFDFATAFGKPVKMVNDAAMQALGSYEGGRMLFLGLGTGLGSALVTGHVVIPLELGQLPFDGELTFSEVLGRKGLDRSGKGEWRRTVNRVVTALMRAFVADYVVIGGGNAKHVKDLPPGSRRGHNLTAFRGGFRLWSVEDVWVLAASGGESPQPTAQEALRLL
jgi:polyphosphate glucokinase